MENRHIGSSGYEKDGEARGNSPLRGPRPQPFGNFDLRDSDDSLIAQMTPKHQAILWCKGGYTEIAQKLNIPLGTVRSRLHRARAALVMMRQAIAGTDDPLQSQE